jgi:hypothetical protein
MPKKGSNKRRDALQARLTDVTLKIAAITKLKAEKPDILNLAPPGAVITVSGSEVPLILGLIEMQHEREALDIKEALAEMEGKGGTDA